MISFNLLELIPRESIRKDADMQKMYEKLKEVFEN